MKVRYFWYAKSGYIVEIWVYDRTIVNNSSCNHYSNRAVVGLFKRITPLFF
ncbi:MAG: hypothetical protein QXQ75_04200 [Candidatus Nitrosocaldaceae archaeon]